MTINYTKVKGNLRSFGLLEKAIIKDICEANGIDFQNINKSSNTEDFCNAVNAFVKVADKGAANLVRIRLLDGATIDTIMDTTNGHNPSLVEQINKAYREQPKLFAAIVYLLGKRDEEEMACKIGLTFETLKDATANLDRYLMSIADDTDLECIISFCRI